MMSQRARSILRLVAILGLAAFAQAAFAQATTPDILNTPVSGSVANWIIRTFGLLTILSVAPGILVMVTSFTRFAIAARFSNDTNTSFDRVICTSMPNFSNCAFNFKASVKAKFFSTIPFHTAPP